MTVIVAARTAKDGIVIASDTQTSSGWEKKRNDASKLWIAGKQFALGGAGCVRTSQVIRHFTVWPKYRPDEDTDPEAFLVQSVWPAIQTALRSHGVLHTEHGEEWSRSQLIIGWGTDHLATISGNGAVIRPFDGRAAIGSGYAEALGFLGADGPWTKADVIEAARRAAISAHGVAGPFDVVTTKALTVEAVGA